MDILNLIRSVGLQYEASYGALAGLSKIIYDATSFGYVALLDSAVQSFTVGSMTKQDASR